MKKILGAAIGTCVHISGLHHFLKLAEQEGYHPVFGGPAVSIPRLIEAILKERPDIVAISYRLTPEVAEKLFKEIEDSFISIKIPKPRMIFGGTPPVSLLAKQSGLFEYVFDGSQSIEEIRSYLRGTLFSKGEESFPQDLLGRISQKFPYPLIRHHFGRPTMQETIEGIRHIALSGVLDIISIGPDQNAQENFFRPDQMDPGQTGAGGVPVRTIDDMKALYNASRCGNYPLMRCYAGTQDLLKWAQMSVETIHNAWAAIPLCWYSILDGRSSRTMEAAITENQLVMRWYANRKIPVEVNESHQWSLRDAHDSLAVAMAFLAAYNAKKMGVSHYIAQFMFNTPPGTSPQMDIAKMWAKMEIMHRLEDDSFQIFRQVRAGIAHFSPVPSIAKGQLAASAVISLALKPHILHVVSYSEGDHATYPDELIESCQIVHGVIRNCLDGFPDFFSDQSVIARKNYLIYQADRLLSSFHFLAPKSDDPFTNPLVIAKAIQTGILDTPHFTKTSYSQGGILTNLINGAWDPIDPQTGKPMDEETRILRILESNKFNQ